MNIFGQSKHDTILKLVPAAVLIFEMVKHEKW